MIVIQIGQRVAPLQPRMPFAKRLVSDPRGHGWNCWQRMDWE